jgi:dTMP kinase
MTGRFIVFEGGDASGKSTQAQLLAVRLDALLTHQPGGTEVGKAVRSIVLDPANTSLDPRAEALLIAADKAQHVAQIVLPALQHRDVVCDRYVASSIVYQGFGRGIDLDELRSLLSFATHGLLPDLTLLLEAPANVVEERLAADRDRFEAEPNAFHQRVRDGYRRLAADDPERWVIIDGSGSVDEVAQLVLRAVHEKLPPSP